MKQDELRILGVRVDNVTMAEAAGRIAGMAAAGGFHQVVTVNPEFIMAAQADSAFAAVLERAALAVPDGVGLVWAARWRRRPLRERVPGVDLVQQVCRLAAAQGLRVYFLGAAPGVAEEAAQRLAARYPGLPVAGAFAGSPRPDDETAILARLVQARPQVLFVAYGAPRQDLWIDRHRQRLGAMVALGVGGSFDFITGKARRAPLWLQRLGLEWLHRLYHEPWRWRRMLALPRFVWAVVRER